MTASTSAEPRPFLRTFLRTPAGLAAVAAIFLLGAGLRIGNLDNVGSRSPDERVYTNQARTILEGRGGFRALVEEYWKSPELRLYPPPTRVGFVRLIATIMRISGVTDERAGAQLSCAASIGTLALLILFGIRFLPPAATLAGGLFFAVSPMELALSRRAWPDALVELLGFALLFLAAGIARNPDRHARLVPYVLIGSFGITVKESSPVAYGLVSLWLLHQFLVRRRDPKGAFRLAVTGLAGAAVAGIWLATETGGLSALWEIIAGRPGANAANAYAIEYQTGPAWSVLQSFWLVAPVASLLAVLGLCVLAIERFRPSEPASPSGPRLTEVGWWVGVFLLSVLALPMIFPHWVNLRYVSPVFGPFYVIAGIGAWFLLELASRLPGIGRQIAAFSGVAAIVLSAAADVRYFERVFVQRGIPDLSIRMLLEAETPLPEPSAAAARPTTPAGFLELSVASSRAGRHLESIAACREALKLQPDFAEAHNNLAAAYEELAMWDEAIAAAREALRIRPDFQLAKNNLEWSISQKKLRDEAATAASPRPAPTGR